MKMRFSEAVMLAHTMGLKCHNANWDTCLCGMAARAVGNELMEAISNPENITARSEWPWLDEYRFGAIAISNGEIVSYGALTNRGDYVVTWLANFFEDGSITIEQVVDYLRQIEPATGYDNETPPVEITQEDAVAI